PSAAPRRAPPRRAAPMSSPPSGESPALFRWECGPGGNIGWVDGAPRGALVGRSIARAEADEGVDRDVERAFARRAPFRDATLSLPEAGLVAGQWLISGVPAFAPGDGRFVGYRGIARRAEALVPPSMKVAPGPLDPAALRELVHEIKTPLNAIIGFAEIIDGHYLGPAQSAYRERAAEIVVQARILLAAIDDFDAAARLRARSGESAATADFTEFFAAFADRLRVAASARGVTLAIDAPPGEGLCTLDRELAERLLDRFSDAVLAAAAPGETLRLAVRREEGFCALRLSRPRALEGLSDSAMFGGGEGERVDFSLRMVVGLAAIVGGKLVADGGDLVLRMPMAQ
ncbi:MAG: histidine kinase dimerization/phospho-acceptor domain-containing protein, partial [Sphingomicrobium sp.]